MKWLKRFLIGKPLASEALKHEKYSVFWGLPILSSDAISSVAYATEEILLVLVPVIGLLAFKPLSYISGAIVLLLAILTFSYRQSIASYPCGGGAYIVASENLGIYAGVIAGSSLALDYILTTAVSISAGTAAVTSVFPHLFQYRVEICLVILLLLYLGNLRGIRESAKLFGTPTYIFVLLVLTMIIIAANTAFADFPMLFSVMSRDGFAPRQLSYRGERLSYSNGITALTLIAALLIFIFKGDTHRLIPLYAVGVFISFTLSQSGMFVKWLRSKEKGWVFKAIVNGVGALVTFITVIIIGATKFIHGAWIIILVIPILMLIMLRIKRHYLAVSLQLRLEPHELEAMDLSKEIYRNHVIVPVESINKTSIRALRYAKTISSNVVAFNIAVSPENERRIKEKWSLLKTDIPLIIKYSPQGRVIKPLLQFIELYEFHNYQKGDMITIILPQFSVRARWQILLHNQSRARIQKDLLKHKHIVVATMPLRLKPDDEITKKISLF